MAEKGSPKPATESDSSILRSSNYCSIHPKNVVKKFCYQHDALLCNVCNSKKHYKCDYVVSIEEASTRVRQSFALEDLKSRMNGLLEHFDCHLDTSDRSKADLREQKEQILNDIQETRIKINSHLDAIERAIKEKLDKNYNICQKANEQHLKQVRSKQKDVQTWKDSLLSFENDLDNKELFKVIKTLDKKTFSYESKVSETLNYLILDYKISENIMSLIDELKSFGEISICERQETIQHLPKLQEGVKRLPNIDRKPALRHSFRTSTLKSAGTSIRRGCFLPNDKLLLSDFNEPYIYITNIDGSATHTIKLENQPCDVDVIDNHKAIVTLGSKGYQILNLGTLTLGPCITPDGCETWSVSCRNGQILVRSDDNTISHITIDGEIKHTYTTEHKPDCIHQCDDSDIYYSNIYEQAVFKLKGDNEGEEEFFTHPDLHGPRGIAGDDQGNLYMAAYYTNTIHRVHTTSKSQFILLSKDDGIKRPRDICYNRDTRQLLVVNYAGGKINIYDM